MHDLDRKDLVFEAEGLEEDMYPDMASELDGDELAFADGAESEGVFNDVEQSELASELLGVSSDEELDQFLGNILRKVSRRVGPLSNVLKSKLGGYLKGAVKTALPKLAGVAGGAFGGPLGAVIASQGAPALGSLLGLELEGLSSEDQEFEAAKQLVQLAGSAIENATQAASNAAPTLAAKEAVIAAAQRHAPGLLTRGRRARASAGAGQRGYWYRQGNRIVLVGV